MKFIESADDGWAAEAERMAAEIEQQKKEWELGRLQALKEEEERLAHNSDDELLAYSSADAHNQVNMKKKKGRNKGRPKTKGLKKAEVESSKVEVFEEREEREKSSRTSYISTSGSEKESECESDFEQASDSDSREEMSSSEEVYNPGKHKLRNSSGASATSRTSSETSMPKSPPPKVLFSTVSEDSPRTRSRGHVKINLWTLDVNPVLPGERPMPFSRKQLANLRDQGMPMPPSDEKGSPTPSDDRGSNLSGQAVNGELERGEGKGPGRGEGEDLDVDVVGDSGDSNTVEGTQVGTDDGNSIEDLTGTLKSNGPTQITVENGGGL